MGIEYHTQKIKLYVNWDPAKAALYNSIRRLINLENTQSDTLITMTTYGDIATLSSQLVAAGRTGDGEFCTHLNYRFFYVVMISCIWRHQVEFYDAPLSLEVPFTQLANCEGCETQRSEKSPVSRGDKHLNSYN